MDIDSKSASVPTCSCPNRTESHVSSDTWPWGGLKLTEYNRQILSSAPHVGRALTHLRVHFIGRGLPGNPAQVFDNSLKRGLMNRWKPSEPPSKCAEVTVDVRFCLSAPVGVRQQATNPCRLCTSCAQAAGSGTPAPAVRVDLTLVIIPTKDMQLTLLKHIGYAVHVVLVVKVKLLLVKLDALYELICQLRRHTGTTQLTFCTPACLPLMR